MTQQVGHQMIHPAAQVVLPDAKDFIVVKNTFIDLDDGPRTRTNANECSPCELKKPSVEADLPGGGRGTPLNGRFGKYTRRPR